MNTTITTADLARNFAIARAAFAADFAKSARVAAYAAARRADDGFTYGNAAAAVAAAAEAAEAAAAAKAAERLAYEARSDAYAAASAAAEGGLEVAALDECSDVVDHYHSRASAEADEAANAARYAASDAARAVEAAA